MSKVYFIGDTHFGHANIINFSRPEFEDLKHMHETIIEAWNSVVNKRDTVYHLGDVSFNNYGLSLVGRLNGNKHLVMGNHDKNKPQEYFKYFSKIHGMKFYKDALLSHMPAHEQCLGYRCKFNIHGHVHFPEHTIPDIKYQCVNMDCLNGYHPISYEQIVSRFNQEHIYDHLFKY